MSTSNRAINVWRHDRPFGAGGAFPPSRPPHSGAAAARFSEARRMDDEYDEVAWLDVRQQ